jgi:hypothetical protein
VLAVAALALIAATVSVYHVSLFPPKLEPRMLTYGTGRMQLLVDSPRSPLVDSSADVAAVTTRAQLYASFSRSTTVANAIARELDISPANLYVANAGKPTLVTQSRIAETRASALFFEGSHYRLYIAADPEIPVLTLSGLAPDGAQAQKLVTAAATAIQQIVREREVATDVPAQNRVGVSALGQPAGGTVNGGARKLIGALVGAVALILGCVLLLIGANVVEALQRLARRDQDLTLRTEP